MQVFVLFATILVTFTSLAHGTFATDDNITTTPAQEKWITNGIPLVSIYFEKRSVFDPPAKLISVPGCPKYIFTATATTFYASLGVPITLIFS